MRIDAGKIDDAETVSDSAAEAVLIRQRWPDGVRCPRCGSGDQANRNGKGHRRWRCRKCRHDFGVTTGTYLHASKVPLAAWVAAALGAPVPGTMEAPTRRRIRRTVESTGLGPGPERLTALVAARQAPPAPGPLAGLAEGHRRVLAVLRTRLAGATAERVATDSGLSASHTRRCLRHLRDAGFVDASHETVMWGYTARRARLWRLEMSAQTLDALPQMGWLPPAEPDDAPETVPPEFWYLFWSGECASELRLPHDAVHIADTLIGGPDHAARTWALNRLPLRALHDLRSMRGYGSGPVAERLDAAIRRRSCANTAAKDQMSAVIDNVAIDVFMAPYRGDNPGRVKQLHRPMIVDGLRVASLPDLLATKLDIIMYRPKLRDYIDIAAIDASGRLRIEDGLALHMQRYGTTLRSNTLDHIVDLLEKPGQLATDRVFGDRQHETLDYLAQRVPQLRTYLLNTRLNITAHQTQPSPRRGGETPATEPH